MKLDSSLLNTVLLVIILIWLISRRLRGFKYLGLLKGGHAYDGQIHDESIVMSNRLAPVAYITTDEKGIIKAWNNKAEEFYGYKESDVLGTNINTYIPENYQQLFEMSKQLDNGIPIEMDAFNKKKDPPRNYTVQCSSWKWKEMEGDRMFYTSILLDITHRKANEQMKAQIETSLVSLKAMYLEAEKIDCSGIWRWDVLNDKVTTSQGFNEIFDVDVNDSGGPAAYFMRRVHGQDRPKVQAAIDKLFATKLGYEIDYRVIGRDGSINHVHCKTKAYLDEFAELSYVVGTVRVFKTEFLS